MVPSFQQNLEVLCHQDVHQFQVLQVYQLILVLLVLLFALVDLEVQLNLMVHPGPPFLVFRDHRVLLVVLVLLYHLLALLDLVILVYLCHLVAQMVRAGPAFLAHHRPPLFLSDPQVQAFLLILVVPSYLPVLCFQMCL